MDSFVKGAWIWYNIMVTYRKHKKPSEKQLKVIALLEANPDLTPTEAGRLAGYSENTVKNMGKNVMQKPLVKSLLDNYQYELNQHGINPARMASKMNELLDASNPIITMAGPLIDKDGKIVMRPDRKIQLGTMKLLHDVYDIKPGTKEKEGLKRRVTLEEFEEGIIQG